MAEEVQEQQIGDYHLIERIAVGGMAEVWKARTYGVSGFEKVYVVKKILDTLTRDEEFVRLFIDEGRIAVLLQHHNIVQVFDLGFTDNTLYMAMEFVDGEDLSKILKRLGKQKLPVSFIVFIVSEVLKALKFAHEKRDESGRPLHLIHCDISPQNILLSNSGEVKITDFGISRAAFQMASLHETVRGKYAYMSPEQIEGQALDHRSDLFSLGIVFWEMLTGKRLFKGRDKDDTLSRVKRAEVPSPRLYRPQISEDVERIVLKALARRPEDRYADAGEMFDALGLLMVAEGYRVTNNDLASYIQALGPDGSKTTIPEIRSRLQTIVVLAAELRTDQGAHAELGPVLESCASVLGKQDAQVWEKDCCGLLAVWEVEADLRSVLKKVFAAVTGLRTVAKTSGASVVMGIAPGRTRIFDDTGRPGRGWELAGPFYLSRWLMNHALPGESLATGLVAASDKQSQPKGLLKLDRKHAVEVHALSL